MELTFGPRGILQIDNARITYKNFAGVGSKFNREGERNFSLIIPDEVVFDKKSGEEMELKDVLKREGWNVKIKKPDPLKPRDEDDKPFMHLPVKVKFNDDYDPESEDDRGPYCYLITGNNKVRLGPDNIGCLDNVWIDNIRLDIRPYDWEVNGKTGRTAYLHAIEVTQSIVDRFADRDEYDY